MHERGLAEKILQMAIERAKGARISKVSMRVGELRSAKAESLQFWFDHLSRDSNCEGAKLDVVEEPMRWACSYCGQEYHEDTQTLVCPNCGSLELEMISGRELSVDGVETLETI